jgi:hypothetical protein
MRPFSNNNCPLSKKSDLIRKKLIQFNTNSLALGGNATAAKSINNRNAESLTSKTSES